MDTHTAFNNKIYKKIVVYKFNMFSGENDPEIAAGQILYDWEHSPMGQFVMTKSFDKPIYNYYLNHSKFSYEFVITANLEEKHITEYYLRWGKFLQG